MEQLTLEKITFKFNVFEGPLDLMLHLISKHQLNIHDIEISLLLTQYLSYIEEMRSADLEVASEFLIMAARLVYIKTVSLLPAHDEGEALKRELEGQLLEYQLCKLVAQRMAQIYLGDAVFLRNPQKIPIDKTYSRTHSPEELLEAYISCIGRQKRKLPPPRAAFSGIVSRRIVSVESRIVFVLKKLYENEQVPYNEFFYPEPQEGFDRSEIVATFLAMLELIKSNRITVNEDNTMVIFNRMLTGLSVEQLAMEAAEELHREQEAEEEKDDIDITQEELQADGN